MPRPHGPILEYCEAPPLGLAFQTEKVQDLFSGRSDGALHAPAARRCRGCWVTEARSPRRSNWSPCAKGAWCGHPASAGFPNGRPQRKGPRPDDDRTPAYPGRIGPAPDDRERQEARVAALLWKCDAGFCYPAGLAYKGLSNPFPREMEIPTWINRFP